MATITLKDLARVTSVPHESHNDVPSGPAYASFGDEGVTATANAHGHLLQITRYFGNEPSGFFCVDLPETPPPNLIAQRQHKLQDFYEDPNVGMRLEFENPEEHKDWVVDSQAAPTMKFIDDRWPLFIRETPSFNLSIQYIISKKTIYQVYSFELKNERHVENIPNIFIDANLLIRNLNFAESNKENNRADPKDSDNPRIEKTFYETRHDTRIIRKHNSVRTGIPGIDTVGLVIMPFINGQNYDIEEKSRNNYRICPGNDVLKGLKKTKKMTVTIAYTLELIWSTDSSIPANGFSKKATQDSSLAKKDLKAAMKKMDLKFETLSFTKENHLNFILRRNLEHILSVCSIPIMDSSEMNIVPVALTCGDMSNHQIMAGATFHAFELLLLALQHLKSSKRTCSCDLKDKHCEDYKCRMRFRIQRTCHGHLIWLFKIALLEGLNSHHWANGKVIKSGKAHLAEKSIIDIPFRIVKAADFFQIAAEKHLRNDITAAYRIIFERWILSLHLDNKNKEYAIIWRALKSGENFGFEPLHIANGSTTTSYSALDVQNSVLKKFSWESSVSSKPMITISRNVYGNTFKLNIQDTAIFYAMDRGIFTTSENSSIGQRKMELWMNTLDHQMESDGSISTTWDDLSHAALAVIMSAKSRHTKSDSMRRRHESAKSALLRSSSLNGLFTGQSDEFQEAIFSMNSSESHNYWHAAFEIPYILWIYGANSTHVDRSLGEHASNGEVISHTALMESATVTESYHTSNQFHNGEKRITNYNKGEKVLEYPNEWLYTKPRFMTFEIDLNEETAETFYAHNKSGDEIVIGKAFDIYRKSSKTSPDSKASPKILRKRYIVKTSSGSKASSENSKKGYIVDVPEFVGSVGTEDFLPNYIYQATNLRLHIDPRIRSAFVPYNGDALQKDPLPMPAKKRLMHFDEMNYEIARACYQASSEAENLSRFFDRHATYDKYFYEDAQLIFNSWTTELHLSFYQILSGDLIVPSDIISELKTIPFPGFRKGEKAQSMNKVSMSLRFDGDIFDSSWICHFVEFNPRQLQTKTQAQKTEAQQTAVQPFTEINISNIAEKNLWQERRILELLMFERMLDEMLQSSNNVLKQIKHSIWKSSKRRVRKSEINAQETDIDYDLAMLLIEFEILDKTPADVFLSIRSAWHQFQRITDIVEEDLKENIDTIDLWINREGKRHDKPQWSESSEQKFGWTISQLLARNHRKYDELRRCYDSIKVFNASLTKRMEVASSKWEIQSSDDIRLFTYVTVVFLPISFATGLFSMSDTPSENVLRHMIIVAAVALGATIIALFNAKALDSKLVRPIFKVCRYILKGFFDLLYYIVVLPCIYLVARHIYYPAFPPAESSNKTSITQEEAATDSTGLANFAEKARILFHKFDNPISLARENFEKAKSQREETKKKTSMA